MQGTAAGPFGFERRTYDAQRVRARRTRFVFTDDIPRYWLGGNPARTHLVNALHLFLPPFERMLAQTVRHAALPALVDPLLRQQARGYMAQEAVHARCHALFAERLRAQGYQLDRYLAALDGLFGGLRRRLGGKLGLAVMAAFEHYTRVFVALTFDTDFLAGCHPAVRELLDWHAAEEVEHGSIAFDLLQAIAPGRALRIAGSVLALLLLYAGLLAGSALLSWQDGSLLRGATLSELATFFVGKYRVAQDAARLFADYARVDYRPQLSDYSQAASAILSPVS